MIQPAHRIREFHTHFFAELHQTFARLQRQGMDIIRLDEGSPDLPPAPHILEALEQAARQPGSHGYQSQRGTAELREAWVQMYARDFNVKLDPEKQVLPLIGSKEGIFHLPLAFLEPGDVVLAPDPGYVTYTRGAQIAGAEVYHLPLLRENGYFPDFAAIPAPILKRARLMWLNYPNNPTGAVATKASFAMAVDFARQHGVLLAHDAAYTKVTFEGYQAPSLLQIPGADELTVEFNTLSKTYNMAGWRIGAVVGSPQVIQILYSLKTNLDSGHFYPIHQAAIAALVGDQSWLESRNQIYRQRRDCLVDGLRGMNFAVDPPKGSLYLWVPLPAGMNSVDFASRLLESTGVSLTPGTVFGSRWQGFVRISITAPIERIEMAMERMRNWVQTWA